MTLLTVSLGILVLTLTLALLVMLNISRATIKSLRADVAYFKAENAKLSKQLNIDWSDPADMSSGRNSGGA